MGGSETELSLVLKAKNLASREVDKLHSSLSRIKGGAGSAVSGLASFGKTAGLLAGGGLLAVVGILGAATKAAADEERGVARLNAALKANDKSFTGNSDAIEAAITKREELAFSDDDLRASLTLLVTKTHDSNKALALQTTAMDLARLKGIGLEEASAMLTKGLDGNSKVLKQLGIDLPATATQQERLTAIQKVSAGQAAAYGKTAAGAQEAFQIALGDVVEEVGAAFLPVMVGLFGFLRTTALPAIRNVIAAVQKWLAENKPLVEQIKTVVGGALKGFITTLVTIWTKVGEVIGILWGGGKGPLAVALRGAAGVFDVVTTAVGFVVDKIAGLIGWIKDAINWLGDFADANRAAAQTIISGNNERGDYGGGRSRVPGHAAGGWVGLNGPELGWLGEKGPEYITPNHALPGPSAMPGYQLVAVSERDIARAVDERLYFMLRRAAPTSGRV